MQVDPVVVVGAATAVGGFLAWLIRAVLADAWKQRDTAMDRWAGQAAATEKLASSVDRLSDIVQKQQPTS